MVASGISETHQATQILLDSYGYTGIDSKAFATGSSEFVAIAVYNSTPSLNTPQSTFYMDSENGLLRGLSEDGSVTPVDVGILVTAIDDIKSVGKSFTGEKTITYLALAAEVWDSGPPIVSGSLGWYHHNIAYDIIFSIEDGIIYGLRTQIRTLSTPSHPPYVGSFTNNPNIVTNLESVYGIEADGTTIKSRGLTTSFTTRSASTVAGIGALLVDVNFISSPGWSDRGYDTGDILIEINNGLIEDVSFNSFYNIAAG